MILNGVDTYNEKTQKYEKVFLFDKLNPNNNNFLVSNQVTIIQDNNQKRLDIVIYLNGIPISIIELKNPSDEKTTIENAFDQIKTYQSRIQQSEFLLCRTLVLLCRHFLAFHKPPLPYEPSDNPSSRSLSTLSSLLKPLR